MSALFHHYLCRPLCGLHGGYYGKVKYVKVNNPDFYLGKFLRIYSLGGIITEGRFAGYNYNYKDDDDEFLEFDVTTAAGIGYSFTEDEMERIEIVDERN